MSEWMKSEWVKLINQSMIQIHSSITNIYQSINQRKKVDDVTNNQINQSQIKVNWNWFGSFIDWLVVEIKRHLCLKVKQTNKDDSLNSSHLNFIECECETNKQTNQMKQTTNNLFFFQINQSQKWMNEIEKERKEIVWL